MAKRRIPLKPNELRDQLTQAVAGIQGETSWPATAPTELEVNGAEAGLSTAITSVENLKAQLDQARATLYANRDHSVDLMKRIDEVTDGLYGPDSPMKENFGLSPKKTSHGQSQPLEQVIITKADDGISPASIFVDWDCEPAAAAYQIEWYGDAILTQQVGNAAVSASDYEIIGLEARQQYWARVRAIRGTEFGPWSDSVTRVANI